MIAGLPGPQGGLVCTRPSPPAVCCNSSGMRPRQPEIGHTLGVHMQYIPRAAPSGPALPRPASIEMLAAQRRACGPHDAGSARGTELLLTEPPASAPVVIRVLSKPHFAPRFVVQLCQSTQPIKPLDIPQLDLFELYHLYFHSEARNGLIRHSLRLGYFKEPGHAKAIAAYLAPHFRHPLIAQIDAAEIVSSLRQKFLPQKDIGASGQHAAVVLVTPPPLRTETHTEAPIQSANRSFDVRSRWSRLLNPFRRVRRYPAQLHRP